MEYCLSLGSNLGDSLRTLRRAAARLAATPGVRITAHSGVYQSDPVDVPARFANRQFLNAIILLETRLSPPELLARISAIEIGMGRRRGRLRNVPRTIDIDIVYAGRRKIATEVLTIPHPRWQQRRFVVQPLARLRPDLVLPGSDLPVRAILDRLPSIPGVTLYTVEW